MFFPVRLVGAGWPAWVRRRLQRFTWPDPRVVVDDDPDPHAFREAMTAVHVGGTYRITAQDRHRVVDDLLLEHVDLAGATLVDIGVSDGSTAVDLVRRLPPTFAAYYMCDRYLALDAVRGRATVGFYDPTTHRAVLVAGPRFLAWPEQSALVRRLLTPVLTRLSGPRHPVSLLGPDARALVRRDSRVHARAHDVFEPWTEAPRPDVVKVANLLRRLYFSDEQITRALTAILASLDEGGYLLLIDNPRIPGIDIRGGLFTRRGGRFVPVAMTSDEPEVLDLVVADAVSVAPSGPEEVDRGRAG